ncbi:GatA Asp-tRNAAsn/Glu-tRNAGln amidotransferase A subunit and related amidases [Burkholderiaceae bacterium]
MHWLTAAQIANGYREGLFSPTELIKHLFARIDKLDPDCNAFISIDRTGAIDAAQQAEKDIRAGKQKSPLHGVPIGIKDIIDVAGEVTTCHSALMLDHVAKTDAAVIRNLRAAGAIIFGKLALHEFAIGGPSFDLPFPPARNPWNLNHHPGGSSSGSGTAVAAGFLPLALGTDTGGSIRNPAAACGIVGLKATYELVSRQGVFPLSFSLDHVGPMCRSVEDAALLLDTLVTPQSNPQESFAVDLKRGVTGLRIGFIRNIHERDMIADPEVIMALNAAANTFKELGATVREVEFPQFNEMAAVQKVIQMSEGWGVHAKWLSSRAESYAQTSRRKLLAGAFFSAADYVHAMQRRSQFIRDVDDMLRDYDVLLCANSMEPACRIDDAPELLRTYSRHARTIFNLTGHPALALMSGLSKSGLPLSMQLVGRYFDERTVLRAGAAFESATNWHRMHPQLD